MKAASAKAEAIEDATNGVRDASEALRAVEARKRELIEMTADSSGFIEQLEAAMASGDVQVMQRMLKEDRSREQPRTILSSN